MGNLLWEGINLMMVGMGAVFVFLMLLVLATGVMSALVAKLLPQPFPPSVSQLPSGSGPPSAKPDDGQLVAIIAAAIQRHRTRHK